MMCDMPTFSVIIPTFNRAEVLRDSIESVLRQSTNDVEVVVVDDGSSDETAAVLDEYRANIIAIRQPNAGAAAARNRGIDVARGRYVAFLDSDDAWAPWTVEVLSRAVAEFGSPAVVAGHGCIWEDRLQARWQQPRYREAPNFLHASIEDSAFRGMGGLAIRADVLRRAGGFRTAFLSAEDQDLCLRLGHTDGFVEVITPSLFFQRTNLQHLSRDVAKAIGAADLLIDNEERGTYPGGADFAAVRRSIICAAARRTADMCARAGRRAAAWRLYGRSFGWHVAQHRWRFLLGFPILLIFGRVKSS